jgi:multiple sugar transport system substrate-binding protein
MHTIEFSIAEAFAGVDQLLEQILLGSSHRAAVHMAAISWDTMWNELVRFAMYKGGPVVSEAGTTWLDALVSMEGLRPFTAQETSLFGTATNCLPVSVQSGVLIGRPEVWGVPWMADTRVIYYWRDMLADAGVDEAGAFRSIEQMEDTLQRLRSNGIATPWAVATINKRDLVYNVTAWVRGLNGDFVSEDGKQLLVHQPEALRGMSAYFQLYRFMPGWPEVVIGAPAIDLFRERRVAALLGGPWLVRDMHLADNPAPAEAEQISVAAPPGPAFVGGSDLVVWQHATHEDKPAIDDALRYLFTTDKVLPYYQLTGMLPVRLDLLAQPFYANNHHYQRLIEILKQGRTHPRIAAWGLVEERLTSALVRVEQELRSHPDQDIAALLASQIEPMAERLVMILGTGAR